MALNFLSASITQGSADAFVTTDISTPVGQGALNLAMAIREILIERPTAAANAAVIEMALSRASAPAAIPALTALGLIFRRRYDSYFTTSGATNQQAVEMIKYDEKEILVVESTISWSLDSATTSASNNAKIRIGYELVKVSENEFLNLRLNALAV